ncbi:MAG: FAD-dependent oxidoreductase, partial [Rhodanobacteraceae bacterium]
MKSPTHFVVLGAGPMGLMATMELLKAGHQVDLYERDDRIGGMSASFDFDGVEIE